MGAPVSSRPSCPVKLCTDNQIVSPYLGLFRLTLEHPPTFLLGPTSGLSRPFWLSRFPNCVSGSHGRAGCGVVKRTCSINHAWFSSYVKFVVTVHVTLLRSCKFVFIIQSL